MLREKSTKKDSSSTPPTPFCIANYHMRCACFAPMVMIIHAEMASRRTQILEDNHPYILAGVFNILKQSSTYRLLTTGLPPDDDTFLTPKYGLSFKFIYLFFFQSRRTKRPRTDCSFSGISPESATDSLPMNADCTWLGMNGHYAR